jgi:hypothetical protein
MVNTLKTPALLLSLFIKRAYIMTAVQGAGFP